MNKRENIFLLLLCILSLGVPDSMWALFSLFFIIFALIYKVFPNFFVQHELIFKTILIFSMGIGILFIFQNHQFSSCTIAFSLFFFILPLISLSWKSYSEIVIPISSNKQEKILWREKIIIGIFVSLFLIFGIIHLGSFMSVDEPKWVGVRVPQLIEAFQNQEWGKTYINDKPGFLPALISSPIFLFSDYPPLSAEGEKSFLFWWRLPLLIFNALSLIIIFSFSKNLFGKYFAITLTGIIAFHPILLGISQIVNPDTTLWNFGFLSFLSFFLALKTNQSKYFIWSGFFLGFALLSKYFASLFYYFFFFTLIVEYLISKDNISFLRARIFSLCTLFITSFLVYAIFFPAIWETPSLLLNGSIASPILNSSKFLLAGSSSFFLFDIFILNGFFLKWVKNNKIFEKISIIFYFSVIVFLGFLFINLFQNYSFFQLDTFLFQFNKDLNPFSFGEIFSASGYTFLFTNPPLILFFTIGTFFLFLSPRNIIKQNLPFLSATFFIFLFLIGSSFGSLFAVTRYQILLYPLYSLLATFFLFSVISFEKKKILSFIGVCIFLISSFYSLMSSSPFYLLYSNDLNIKKSVINEAWGFGGYELAQQMNALPNAKNLTIWSDREGFNNFFIGKTYWRGESSPFQNEVDYVVLSQGGQKIFYHSQKAFEEGKTFLYARVVGSTSFYSLYEQKPDFEYCIFNNPNDCIRAIKISPEKK